MNFKVTIEITHLSDKSCKVHKMKIHRKLDQTHVLVENDELSAEQCSKA